MNQIPIGVLAIVGFLVGLIVSFWVAGVFGVSAPLLWASIIIAFVIGVLFLQRPKLFLVVAFLYYGNFVNGVLFGCINLSLPLAGFYDELVLAVPLAYLVMRSINRTLPRGATIFPLAYIVLAYLSYTLNGGARGPWLRTILTYSKFYIYWYFCRAIGPWSHAERVRWFWGVVAFAFVQFIANVIWQGNIILTKHPDYSIGTVANAHMVGYVSSCALFLLMGWFASESYRASALKKALVWLVTILIAYNLIFLTDTKHALLIWPLTVIPLIFHRSVARRYRVGFVMGALLFAVISWLYINHGSYGMRGSIADFANIILWSGKGMLYRTIFRVLPKGNPVFFLFGAGPGNFCSTAAIYSFTPLAVKYVIPYVIQGLSSGGVSAESSVLGAPSATVLVLVGEFGWLGALNYFGFWIWVMLKLWGGARQSSVLDWGTAQRLSLCACLMFLCVICFLADVMPFGQIYFPVWLLVAVYWEPEPATAMPTPQGGAVMREQARRILYA